MLRGFWHAVSQGKERKRRKDVFFCLKSKDLHIKCCSDTKKYILSFSNNFITESWCREAFDVHEPDILLNICVQLGFYPRDLMHFLHLDEHLRKPSEHLLHTNCGTESNRLWIHSPLAGFQPGTNSLRERCNCKLNTVAVSSPASALWWAGLDCQLELELILNRTL